MVSGRAARPADAARSRARARGDPRTGLGSRAAPGSRVGAEDERRELLRCAHVVEHLRAHRLHRDVDLGRSRARPQHRVPDQQRPPRPDRPAPGPHGGRRRRGGGDRSRMKIVGVLSGTSLDGIDVAVCDVVAHGDGVRASCRRFATVPFDDALRARIVATYPPAAVGALELSALHAAIGQAFGDAIRSVAGDPPLDAVASHGVTLAHDGAAHHTLQLGDAFRIRERVGATVVYDFRSADTAAGGTGAPLVPFVDALLFGEYAPCIALNLGGIANLTVLPDGIAFDSGPANLPIDTYVALRSGGAQRYDRGGDVGRGGLVNDVLLGRMLDDPYFRRAPPKTTGREEFG